MVQSFEPTTNKPDTPLVFVLCVGSPSEVRKAEMLIKSLRDFGGKYRDSLVYVVYEENGNTPFEQLKSDNVRFLPLKMDRTPPGYPFARKVYACALKAMELIKKGEDVKALHMTDVILAVDSLHKPSLEARLEALKSLLSKCRNWIERNWLNSEIKRIQGLLKAENP